MHATSDPILDRRECAVLLGRLLRPDGRPVTTRTVHNLVRRGLPRVKVGRFVTFRRSAVEAWVERQK